MSKLSLPVRLALLVAGTTLPLIVFAGGIVFYNYKQDREDATQRVLATVRSILLVLDAEVQRMTGGLQVLALTSPLSTGDYDAFRPIALGFLEQYGRDGVLLVADRRGRQVFSSVTEDTPSLPPRNNRDIVEKVFASKQPAYSNLFIDAVRKQHIVTVEVPVIKNGEVAHVISFNPPIEIFQNIIERQRPNNDWTISIFDGEGINFARMPNPQETVGKRASPTLFAEMFRKPEATVSTVSLEGVPLITSYTRSSLTGWTVAAGIAEGSLVGPLWRNLAITSAIGGLLLLIGLAFAVRMATTIARGEMLQELLVEELNHRVKNTLAILQSIAAQTFRSASRPEREKFEGRLRALAEAHNLLSTEKWQGSDLQDVVGRVLQPYAVADTGRVKMFGPKVPLAPRAGRRAFDDPARDRHQRRQIRRAVERRRHGDAGLGDHRRGRQAEAAPDLDRGRRPAGERARTTRLRLPADRAQRARPARRRGDRRFPAARRGLHHIRCAGERGLAASRARRDWDESSSRLGLLLEHDLFGKPLHVFPDHVLGHELEVGAATAAPSPRRLWLARRKHLLLGRLRIAEQPQLGIGHALEVHAKLQDGHRQQVRRVVLGLVVQRGPALFERREDRSQFGLRVGGQRFRRDRACKVDRRLFVRRLHDHLPTPPGSRQGSARRLSQNAPPADGRTCPALPVDLPSCAGLAVAVPPDEPEANNRHIQIPQNAALWAKTP